MTEVMRAVPVQDEKPLVLEDRIDPMELVTAPYQREDKYRRPITEQERNSFNQEIADKSLSIDALEEEKRETAKHYTAQIKAEKGDRKAAMVAVKTGQIEVSDRIYGIPDFTTNKMHEYNSAGERIAIRSLKPSELQTSIQ